MKSKSMQFQSRRLVAMGVASATLMQAMIAPAYAAVSQVPGIYVTPPDVNVMFTLDDSGSMQADALPDFADADTTGFPAVDANTYFYSLLKYPNMWGNSSGFRSTTYYRSNNAIARYMRSSSGNALYYDRKITYLPWPTAANDKVLSPAATTTAVRISTDTPFSGGITMNLTTRVNVSGGAGAADNQADNYWPATYYVYRGTTPLRLATPNDPNNTSGNFTKVEIKPSVATYNRATKVVGGVTVPDDKRTDCGSGLTCTYAQELQNFANWLQYYRNRRLMAKGGIAAAFATQGTNLRLGFASLNSAPVVRRGVSQFSGANRTAFYNDLYPLGNAPNAPYTPLRKAMDEVGKYFQRSDIGNPWAEDPTSTTTVGKEYSCRKSFHILSTDGFWNDAAASSPASLDNDDFSGSTPAKPDGTTYRYSNTGSSPSDPLVGRFKIDPFKDSRANTLADVAAYYWKTDLRPDTGMPNNVSPSRRDPAFWQHLTTFTVGLGISGTGQVRRTTAGTVVDLSSQSVIDGLLAMSPPPALTWTAPANDNPATGDDLIHAAMNGRGRYFLATDPTSLAAGLASALAEAVDQPGSLANLATDAPVVSAGSQVYQATFNPQGWYGRLYAFGESATGAVTATPSTAIWEASSVMPAFGSRNIYSWDTSSAPKKGVPFTWAGLNATQRGYLNNDSTLLDYLRGSDAREIAKGGTFRDRIRNTATGGVLGDIVNGSPIKGPDAGGGYDKLATGVLGQSTYASYRSATSTSLNNMRNTVFVGANDGMLHAFNSVNGVERFAFVPNSVFSVPRSKTGTEQKLRMLADPAYDHRFTVDGPPQIADAFFGTTDSLTGWKTILMGSTGAGARSVFAMDVSNPEVGASGFGPTKILWEFSEADNTDMGYVISYPHVARMMNGKWVAIFGNGYDSANGQAKLFVLDLETGAVVWQQNVGAPDATNKNGLSQPNFVVDENRTVLAIYAGDLKGNLWKFDVSDVNPSNWKVAFGSAPFYSPLYAGSANQPITVMPEISFHESGGAMVSFGTGKQFEVEDTATTGNVNLNTQALYGIWDKPSETAGISGTSLLVQQSDSALASTSDTRLKGTTATSIDWTTRRGWYLNLATGGERVNVNPQQVLSTLLIVANTPKPDPCSSGGTSRLFALDPMTGGAPRYGVFDANGDGNINGADKGYNVLNLTYAVMSLPALQSLAPSSSSGVTVDPVWNNRGKTGALAGGVVVKKIRSSSCRAHMNVGASDTSIVGTDMNLCDNGKPRISWRQIK